MLIIARGFSDDVNRRVDKYWENCSTMYVLPCTGFSVTYLIPSVLFNCYCQFLLNCSTMNLELILAGLCGSRWIEVLHWAKLSLDMISGLRRRE